MSMVKVTLPWGGRMFVTPGVSVEFSYRLPSGRPVSGSIQAERLERFVQLRQHCTDWTFAAVGGQIRRMKHE